MFWGFLSFWVFLEGKVGDIFFFLVILSDPIKHCFDFETAKESCELGIILHFLGVHMCTDYQYHLVPLTLFSNTSEHVSVLWVCVTVT